VSKRPPKILKCPDCNRSFRKQQAVDDHRAASHGVLKAFPVIGRRPSLAEVNATCLECDRVAKLVGGKEIYPHRPDLYGKHFYLCACGAYCGCHPGSVIPLGHPCGPETRRARSAAHEAFDPLWKGGKMTRSSAYAWLAEATGIDPGRCHIGMMNAAEARSVEVAVAARNLESVLAGMAENGLVTVEGDVVSLVPEILAEPSREGKPN
jgi:zinc-finger-containing domain